MEQFDGDQPRNHVEAEAQQEKKSHRKDKPWDNADIDHWTVDPWQEEVSDVKQAGKTRKMPGLLEESSFATLFPKYREKYLREVWPLVTKALDAHKITCELNLVEGSMTVRTTRKTTDPYIVLKGRDLIKLLARSIPVNQAVKILDDEMQCDIIKIGGLVRNKERFVKRRQRLVGPDGATLKAIELLTNCYVLVQGNTVSAMGTYHGLRSVRKIVEDCFANVHPIYNVKRLMIKRELAKDPKLQGENWDRFLPTFRKQNVQTKKPKRVREKKEYTPFPPAATASKVDKEIESGEYFMKEHERKAMKKQKKHEEKVEVLQKRKVEKMAEFVAPSEKETNKKRKTQKAEAQAEKHRATSVEALKNKFLNQKSTKKATSTAPAVSVDDYMAVPTKQHKKKKAKQQEDQRRKKPKCTKQKIPKASEVKMGTTEPQEDANNFAARSKPSAIRSSERGDAFQTQTKQPNGLMVALFHDGFVCRHTNKENECVEGFAQPYDAESRYIHCVPCQACLGSFSERFNIACAHQNGSVLAEVRDYREMRAAMCPVSSAFLPTASALPQSTNGHDLACTAWQTLLLSSKNQPPTSVEALPLFEPPTLQPIFDHFPDVPPSELETLAVDAQRQLLEDEVLPSSPSPDSSSSREERLSLGHFPNDPQQFSEDSSDYDTAAFASTPTTRTRMHSGLRPPPPTSVLSPTERESARPNLNKRGDLEANSTKRCKRQLQKKARIPRVYKQRGSRKAKSANGGLEVEGTAGYRLPEHVKKEAAPPTSTVPATIMPLPATKLFLSKLKGKRRRPAAEIRYGNPAWVTLAHVGRFFRAATRLESEHARFLHVSTSPYIPPLPSQVAGSMRHLARQLDDLTRPTDVVAAADGRKLEAAQKAGYKLCPPEWMDDQSSPGSTRQQVAVMLNPGVDPVFRSDHAARAEDDALYQHFWSSALYMSGFMENEEAVASCSPFNAFDEDGNLETQLP
ncbi:hypothetical protein BBJ28_00007235 [Nothophytophthora sp. Chile5]|nr:hypothetical protein BBJ28_00007235 [Nothophytophthora sp. Chile5]